MHSDEDEDAIPAKAVRNSVLEGRIKLLTATISVVVLCIATIIQYNIVIGHARLPSQIVRFLLTMLLCTAVYKGSVVAERIGLFLFGVGAVITFGFAIILVMKQAPLLYSLTMIANALSYAYYAYVLNSSEDVRAFLASRRS